MGMHDDTLHHHVVHPRHVMTPAFDLCQQHVGLRLYLFADLSSKAQKQAQGHDQLKILQCDVVVVPNYRDVLALEMVDMHNLIVRAFPGHTFPGGLSLGGYA